MCNPHEIQDAKDLFPHAHVEPHKGRYRVVLTNKDGRQEVMRSNLSKAVAESIAKDMRTVD